MHITRTQRWRAACRRAGFWRLADPKISLASLASIFLLSCRKSLLVIGEMSAGS